MIIGEKLENPYSLENMQIAHDNLMAENKLKSKIKIEPTHLYVRFRPKNMQELDMLTRDTTIDVFDYPLDVEIKQRGTYYHDPSISNKEITWQYTVVPVNYVFPKVQYQKLAELYLPEEEGELQELKSASIDYFDWLKLEDEALRITGNQDEPDANGITLKSSSWRPAGTIKVWDDIITTSYSTSKKIFLYYNYSNGFTEETMTQLEDLIDSHVYADDILPQLPTNIANYIQGIFDDEDPYNHYEEWDIMEEIIEDSREAVYTYETNTTNSHFMPLEGVEIRANRWFTTHKGLTDANGNFTCDGTFTRPANYSIKWERWDFDIRDRWWGQAYYNGPKMEGNWNLNIEELTTPKSFNIAHIFRAAYTYYYKHDNWGIKAPPRRDGVFQLLQHRLHIASLDSPGISHYYTFMEFALAAQVLVHDNGNSQVIFATTIHELAHASHWEIGYWNGQYVVDAIFSSVTLPESWATGVEAVITNDVYNTTNYNIKQSSQYTIEYMTTGDHKGYTSMVWDLIDNHNQFGTNIAYPDDQVWGYTLSQLENALIIDPDNWWGWRNNIRDEYNNSTKIHLDKLFHALQ
jgi:hypothetical protein